MRAPCSLLVLFCVCLAGEKGTKVEYIGGTGPWKSGHDLRVGLFDDSAMQLGSEIRVPYLQINQIEYGQKVGRALAPAIIISPLFLLNKTRKHFLTLGFTDGAGKQQAMVFRVGKGDIRAMLAGLEARTGLRVTYLDDDARKM